MAIEETEIQEQAEAEALHGDEGGAAPAPVPHPLQERVEELAKLKEAALHAGSPAAIERQHAKGKLTARERLEVLLDPGSFVELDMLARHRAHGFDIERTRPLTDGVVTGWGTVDGRKVFVFSQDFTIFGGALGEVFAEKIHKVMDLAESTGAPLVGLNDGAGARAPDGGRQRLLDRAPITALFHVARQQNNPEIHAISDDHRAQKGGIGVQSIDVDRGQRDQRERVERG